MDGLVLGAVQVVLSLRSSSLNLILVSDALHHVVPQPWPVLACGKLIPALKYEG